MSRKVRKQGLNFGNCLHHFHASEGANGFSGCVITRSKCGASRTGSEERGDGFLGARRCSALLSTLYQLPTPVLPYTPASMSAA